MKLTKIAIVVIAVLAMSVVVASPASAKQLKSNAANVVLVGEDTGNHVFTVDGQSITCNSRTFESGTIAVPANEISGVKSVVTGCTSFGFATSTVNMGNCHYNFTTPEQIKTDEYTAKTMIVCKNTVGSANNTINVTSSVFGSECSISIGESGNENLSHVIIHNTTANKPKDLTLTFTINEIRVVKNKDNGLCPLSGTGTVNNGTYNGSLTIKEKNGQDIWFE